MRLDYDRGRAARVCLLAAIFIAAAAAWPQIAMAQVVGSISTVSGVVTLQRGTAAGPVNIGMAVNQGDKLVTGADGHVVVLLNDQSTLELGDTSDLTIDQHTGAPATTRVSLASGALRSFVNKTLGAAAPNFEVHTPNAVAAARGTKFDTTYASGGQRPTYGDCRAFTDVAVYEGVVSLANINSPNTGVDVPAGYEATVPCAESPPKPGPIGLTGATSLNSRGSRRGGGGSISSSRVDQQTIIAAVPPPVCMCPPGEVEVSPAPPPPPPPPPPGR